MEGVEGDPSWKARLANHFRDQPHICTILKACDDNHDLTPWLQAPELEQFFNVVFNYFQNQEYNFNVALEQKEAENTTVAENLKLAQHEVQSQSDMIDKLIRAKSNNIPRRQTDNPKDKFDAKDKDAKTRQQKYVNWRSTMLRNVTIDAEYFNTPYKRILYIGSQLDGDAYDLVREALDHITMKKDDCTTWEWGNSETFIEFLDSQYETLDLSRSAAQEFDTYYMANKPFQNFITEFHKLAARAGKTDAQKVDALRLKVSKEMAAAFTNRSDKPTGKDDWSAWRTFGQKVYDDLEEQAHYAKLRGDREFKKPNSNYTPQLALPQNKPNPPKQEHAGDPMQLDAALALQRKEYRRLHNLCYYCGGQHTVSNCVEKQKADTMRPQTPQGRGGGFPGRGTYRGNSTTAPRGRVYIPSQGRGIPAPQVPTLQFPQYQHYSAQGNNPSYHGNPFLRHVDETGFVEGSVTSSDALAYEDVTPDVGRQGKE